MMTLENVLRKYTLGEASKDETNDALQELSSPLRLDPDRNVITPEELAETRVGETPDVDTGEEIAFVYIGGKCYRLRGDVLTEME